jgi:hypothetical protein
MAKPHFVVCLRNSGYKASLEPRKLYKALPDAAAEKHGQIRIVDESGEDYLYPASFFLSVPLSTQVAAKVAKAA